MISQRFSQIFCFHGTAHTRYSYPVASAEKRFSEEMESLSGKREAESDYANYHQMPLPHCNHTSAANMPERKKNLPEKKKMPKEIKIAQDKKCLRKKRPTDDVAPATTSQPQISEHWYVSSKRWDFTTKCSKRRGKDPIPHIRNILHKHDYEQTLLLSSQYFHFMVAKHASFLGRTFALETNSIQ